MTLSYPTRFSSGKSTVFYLGLLVALVALVGFGAYRILATTESPESLLADATKFLEVGKPRPAILQLKKVLRRDPNHPEARLMLGHSYYRIEQFEFAEKELLRALELEIPRARIEPTLMRSMLARGAPDEVIIRAAVDESKFQSFPDPVRAEVAALTGFALIAENKREQAVDFFNRSASLAPDNRDQLLGRAILVGLDGDSDRYRQELRNVAELHPEFSDVWVYLGDLDAFQLKHSDAIKNYSNAIKLRDLAPTRLKRADTRLRVRDLEGAREDYLDLKQRRYGHPGVRLGLARLQYFDGDIGGSYEAAQKILADFPEYVDASYLAGLASYSQGRLEQAEHYVGDFFDKTPNSVSAALVLSSIALRRGNVDLAEKTVSEALKYRPNDPSLRDAALSINFASGDYDTVIAKLEKRIEANPEATASVMDLAMAQSLKGDAAKSLINLEGAFAADPTSPRAARLLVNSLLAQQHSVRALDVATSHRNAVPSSADAHSLVGEVLAALDKNEESRSAFQRAIDIDPTHFSAHYALAQLAAENEDIAESKRHLHEILNGSPSNLEALTTLAIYSEKEGNVQEAIEYLTRAVEGNPRSGHVVLALALALRKAGNSDEALVVLEDAHKRMPDNALVANELAMNYMSAGRANAALEILGKEVAKNPNVATSQVLLARAALPAGDTDTARAAVAKALSLVPNDRFTNFLAGKVALLDNDLEKAKEHLNVAKAAITLPDPDIIGLEGDIAFGENRFTDAVTLYERAGELQPHNSLWVMRQARSEFEARDGQSAINTLSSWLASHPQDLAVLKNLGEIQTATGETDESIATFERILKLAPDDIVTLNNLAWALRKSHPKRAKEFAERALKANRNHLGILDTYAVVLHYAGDSERALEKIESVIERAGDVPLLNYHYALILDGAGRSESALREVKKALDKDTPFVERDEAAELLARLQRAE